MKIGDLVKYDESFGDILDAAGMTTDMSGLENCMGLIIGQDGLAFVVQWFDRYSKFACAETRVELPEFLEVISESR